MCGRKVRGIFQACLVIMLILTAIPLMPFEEPFVAHVSAGSSWRQTTEQDFNNGTLTDVIVTPEGNVTLAMQTNYVEDDFSDESMIGYKSNITVDTANDEVKLIKFIKTFFPEV